MADQKKKGGITMPDTISIYSMADLIDAYVSYDTTEENKNIILAFLSELTGKSEDSLWELTDQYKRED